MSVDTFILPGTIYNVRIRAKNAIGYSDYSNYLRRAFNALPIAPINLRRVESACTKTQITITWNPVADGIAPGGIIRGYKLYMANGSAGSYYQIYDGTDRPLITTQVISRLTPGEIYRFKASALVFNGEGALSSEFFTYSCVKPSNMSGPKRVSSTATTMTLSWEAPVEDGGCTVTGYAVYRNDGEGGTSWTEVNTPMDSNVRDKPTLLSMIVSSFPANPSGKEFVFKVVAFNEMGQYSSDTAGYVLASVPTAPANGPYMISQSGSQIAIRYDPLLTVV